MCVCAYAFECVYAFIYVYAFRCVYIYARVCLNTCVCMYVCLVYCIFIYNSGFEDLIFTTRNDVHRSMNNNFVRLLFKHREIFVV